MGEAQLQMGGKEDFIKLAMCVQRPEGGERGDCAVGRPASQPPHLFCREMAVARAVIGSGHGVMVEPSGLADRLDAGVTESRFQVTPRLWA